MTFSFIDSAFTECFSELIRLSENSIQQNKNTEVKALFIEHLRFKDFFSDNLKKEFDDLLTCSKDPYDYIAMINYVSNGDNVERSKIIVSASLIYLYLNEYKFRKSNKIEVEIIVQINTFQKNVKSALEHIGAEPEALKYADTRLGFDILQEVFKSSEYQGLANLSKSLDEIKVYCNEWDNTLNQRQQVIYELEKRLEKNKQTYDFVLLNKGFKELYEQKKLELKERREGYSQFGATLVCVPLAVIIAIIVLILTGYESKLASMWFLSIPITTLMLFLFYFTRVGLQHVRSVQSQMMQLELRMALCQFIHNYAEDSEKLHQKNAAGFEKFENIIFSPLVSSDDKIPTTFDGMEQLAKLVNEFRK